MTIKDNATYAVRAYRTDTYDTDSQVVRSFKKVEAMWDWCREYLSQGNRKVQAFSRRRGRFMGMRSSTVHKLGEFTKPEDVPGTL